jgi:hypothetical protein
MLVDESQSCVNGCTIAVYGTQFVSFHYCCWINDYYLHIEQSRRRNIADAPTHASLHSKYNLLGRIAFYKLDLGVVAWNGEYRVRAQT